MIRTALLSSTAAIGYASTPMALTPEIVQQVKQARRDGAIETDTMLKRSPDSAAMVSYWDKVDAVTDGIEGLRRAGINYLPQFADEEHDDYQLRLKLTKYTNVYRDIVEGLASKPFAQNITFPEGTPQEIVDFAMDVDGSGNTISVFGSEIFFNGINNAIDWIFIDHPPRNPNVRNLAQYKAAGLRPYWSHVLGRNVLEARSKVVMGEEALTYIRIYEPGTPDHVRVFERHDDDTVTWTLYVRTDKPTQEGATQFIVEASDTLSINRIPMVPFFTGRRAGRTWRFFPAMQDAVDLAIELYQQESGLKFAKTLTAYPMLAANGITPPKGPDGKSITKVAVGPNRVLWSVPDAQGKVGSWSYVEPNAQSLEFLAKDIANTIRELRELGRQPLTASVENITVITAAVAAGKAKSAVKAWAFGLGNALEEALVITALFKGVTDYTDANATVNVYTEFDEFTEGEDLEALATMRDKGDLSQETLWEEMKRRSVLSTTFDPAKERTRLLAELPREPTEETEG